MALDMAENGVADGRLAELAGHRNMLRMVEMLPAEEHDLPYALPVVTITSGANMTNSATNLPMRSASPAAQRVSMRTLRPSVQPNSRRPCKNAARRACPSRIVLGERHENADPPHPLGLLRMRHHRPRNRRTAEQENDLASL